MHKLRHLLPSGNSLFTFEAAARHESFTEAAKELNVSQPAISRSIHQLEDYLGTKLFHRHHRAIELTAEGRRFYQEVAESLDHLYSAAQGLRRAPVKESIKVSFSSVFMGFWLLPKLRDFSAHYPDLKLHLEVNDRDDKNLLREGIDLSSRLGDGKWSGLRSWRYAEEEVLAVCSPDYLAAHGPIGEVDELPRHQLLQLAESYRVRIGWTEWLHQMGVAAPSVDCDLVFTDADALFKAAQRGQGITLAWRHLVRDQLAEGAMVQPVSDSYFSGLGLYLVAPEGVPMKWGARIFRDWVLAQAKAASQGLTDPQ
ncbi:MAG: LysR substrate-binding domain-containing protein [Pseudomonadota bacterium]